MLIAQNRNTTERTTNDLPETCSDLDHRSGPDGGAAFAQSEMTSEGTAQAADPAIVATDHSAMVHGSADVTASDVTGTPVVLSDGERIGEIDHLGTMNGEPVLVVGVGGFLGLGEHDVAMTLDQLTYDSEQMAFVAAGQTEEQLREMPQYDESQVALVEDDQPLGAEWADIAAVKADAGMDGMTADATDGMATEATDLTAEAKNDTAMETEPVAPLAGNDTMAGETAAPGAFDFGKQYADIAEMPVDEIIGTRVYSEAGEDVGEIDDVGILDAEPVVVVGIGGFLGLGEHDVALNLDRMEYDAERQALVVSGYSEDELKQLPELDRDRIGVLESEAPLSQVWGDKDM